MEYQPRRIPSDWRLLDLDETIGEGDHYWNPWISSVEGYGAWINNKAGGVKVRSLKIDPDDHAGLTKFPDLQSPENGV